MKHEHMKVAIVVGWVLSSAAIAMALSVDSASGWLLLVGVGLLLPLVLFRIWQQPAQTMSESIREVLR